jgi:hypothetical protein
VPVAAADDAATQAVIEDIIACVGAEEDRSGAPGVSQEKIDQFFTEAQAYSDWWGEAERNAANILPLAEGTEAAVPRSRQSRPRWTIISPAAGWPCSIFAPSSR